jgi:citrate synthase
MAHFLSQGSVRCLIRQSSITSRRQVRHSSTLPLKDILREQVSEKRELLKQIRTNHSDVKLGDVKIDNALGGMRGLKAMLWEGSTLDPNDGIRFQGLTISECQEKLPKGDRGTEMLPEGMFWLLLTGKIPTKEQAKTLSAELTERVLHTERRPNMRGVENTDVHPMVRLSTGLLALSAHSKFSKAYFNGINKADYWDSSNLVLELN